MPKIDCHLILVYCLVTAASAYCAVCSSLSNGLIPFRSEYAIIVPWWSTIAANLMFLSDFAIVSQSDLKKFVTGRNWISGIIKIKAFIKMAINWYDKSTWFNTANHYKLIWIVHRMHVHDICLSCGHRKHDHSSDGSRCLRPYCPCLQFKTTFLQYGSNS